MASEIRDNVKEYYGKVLTTNENLQTNACVQVEKVPERVREAISLCHEDVLSKYYGCGLVFPNSVESTKVLDFGSGAGRDCFVMSKLVGEEGFVTGIDMTEEQLDVANKYIQYHMDKFGYTSPNLEFKLGYIENLKDAGIKDESCDLIISNCVINLSPDKPSVFKEAFRVLQEGGEFYFSDIYADRESPQNIKEHKELWGEGLAGAMYWKSFVELTKEIGFSGPYLVTSRPMTCGNEGLEKLLGDSKFVSVTYRLFKTSKKTEEKNCISVKYKGTISDSPDVFKFDHKNSFDCSFKPVSTDIGHVLKNSRYAKHLEFMTVEPDCSRSFEMSVSPNPFKVANVVNGNNEKPAATSKICC
ncbi:arsenite methyltransferase-like isoform X1 [Xenia sp. Carnegie-2017]|uniref:arsenite methyltransferase-like isoform X1 n=2 Tax=Xenia sp. Carnegie-2017 TaxID=2897299 RepID=UPI001F0345E0|nr:arsenite methyltransferase-like isoform X1 [Xenia sp. Carnegie-2017]